jgi:hypothetical protein
VQLINDGAGGSTEVPTILGPYPCRVGVSRLQRGELLQAGQLAGGLPWTVTFKADVDARLADDINVNGAVNEDEDGFVGGRNFEILAIYGPHSYMTALQCICAEKN